ncbi:MAG: aminotransferase class IV [Akkermansiaceae bacterium]|nr:aminotransferase class IV [Akkermansiaceae bacterium]
MQTATNDSADPFVWLDGHLIQSSEARVSPFDHGLLTGDGVFETLVAYRGEPFAPTRHHRRLHHSASSMGLETPPADELLHAMREVLRANRLDSARIRVTVTGGIGPLGSDRGGRGQTFVVAASPVPAFSPTARVFTVPFPRNERGALAGLKTTSYGENVVALYQAKSQGGDEAIFGNLVGNLCEGTGTNIFAVIGGKFITPPLSSGCLAGVTRGLVVELANELGLGLEEADVPLSALTGADEAFLTSTLREVQPIVEVNGQALGAAPGPMAKKLGPAFRSLTEHDLDP